MALTDNTTGGRVIKEGMLPARILLGEACEVGDMLGYSSGWKRALATTGVAIEGRLIAGQSGRSGEYIIAYALAVIGGLTGMTAGNNVYLAEAALYGEVTETQPSTTGDIDVPIGRSLSANDWLCWVGVIPTYADADHLHA